MNENDVIPATPELNRLKVFLANFKPPKIRYTGEDHLVIGLRAANLACGYATPYDSTLKNYGGLYD